MIQPTIPQFARIAAISVIFRPVGLHPAFASIGKNLQ
jgi:hypothetical protein